MTSERGDIFNLMYELRSRGDAFAVATVVRTVSVTAAKPGAKAVLNAQGQIIDGWIGGGCARHAVVTAAVDAIADGQSRLVSIQPEDLLDEQDTQSDAAPVHVHARNMCPSQGSMEVFVEPMLANPQLCVIGSSPVALALAELGPLFDFDALLIDPDDTETQLQTDHPQRYVVIATQGSGDLKALGATMTLNARYVGFVGSRRKIAQLKTRLLTEETDKTRLERIDCPAGLDINAVTPQEIALSIVAELVSRRRA